MFRRLLCTLCIFVLYASTSNADDMPLRFEDILPPHVFKKYDKMKPPKKEGRATEVGFHVTVMQIDSINENSMTYVADVFFAQSWKDDRLALPENMTSEYRLLELDWLDSIWRPDSFFKNAKSVTFQRMTVPNHYVWLYADKTILYMVKLTLTLSCAMNFAMYPHDYQVCRLQMESLSYTTDDLVFVWEKETPLVVDENIELPQLDLVRNYTADCSHAYPTGNFTCLEVVFKFKRRLGYYLFHTYIPTCLIVIMSWISFWIKPEAAPARVTLGVTSLLTLSTQHAKSQSALPPVSYVKSIDSFMNACTVFVFLALIEYALVNIVLGDSPEPGQRSLPPPPPPPRATSVQLDTPIRTDKMYEMVARERELPPYSQPNRSRGAGSSGAAGRDSTSGGAGAAASAGSAAASVTSPAPVVCPRHGSQCKGAAAAAAAQAAAAQRAQTPSRGSTSYAGGSRLSVARMSTSMDGLTDVALTERYHKMDGLTLQQIRRRRAIAVDRASRVLFPATFLVLNATYWIVVKIVEDE